MELRLTCEADLEHVQRLWATPSVMHYVGFPEGLHETMAHLRENWLPWVQQPPKRQHWSVYAEGVGYCGETYYNVDETGLACMDVKLLDCARGKGIGYRALSHALNAAFHVGGADRATWTLIRKTGRLLALYAALGFLPAVRPSHLEPWDSTYFELTRRIGRRAMEFKFRNVVLRDMGRPTLRTKPLEHGEQLGPVGRLGRAWEAQLLNPAAHRRTELDQLKKPKARFETPWSWIRKMVSISVRLLPADQDFNWISKTQPGTGFVPSGLDISEAMLRKGLGTQA